MFVSDAYKLLGVSDKASLDDIKKAHRGLAKQYHPDVNRAPEAEDKMKQVNAAFDTIKQVRSRPTFVQQTTSGFHTATHQSFEEFLRHFAETVARQEAAAAMEAAAEQARKQAEADAAARKRAEEEQITQDWIRRNQQERASRVRFFSESDPYAELNMRRSPISDEELLGVRVGGYDKYSRMSIRNLEVACGEEAAKVVADHIKWVSVTNIHKTYATALRWVLRGLKTELAIRKAVLDDQFYEQKRSKK